MSPTGRPRGRIKPEARSAEGSPVSPTGRPEGESDLKRVARRVPVSARRRLLAILTLLAFSGTPQAQECSGGVEGGTDATGNLCSSSGVPLVRSDSVDLAPAIVLRKQGLEHYERGDYNAAVALFRRAAEQGDLRSAEMIVAMHRYNKLLYAGRVAIDAAEAKKWASVLAGTAQSAVTARGQAAR